MALETTISSTDLSAEQLRGCLRQMHLIRLFEEQAEQLYIRGMIHGTMHLSIGQEASAVGACAALQPDDYILSTHRGHGHCIAKGARIELMMAEFMGKETGYCRGRGGSMHIADVEGGNLGANGIVAGGIPIATGVGLSLKMRRDSRVCLTFFGDGAANEGAFHEALNMAAIWTLPVVFFCENNTYAMSMHVTRAFPIVNIAERAAAYGFSGVTVDGNDLFAVYAAAKEAVDRARSGGGPTLIEAKTYRWRGHSKSDRNLYRTQQEIDEWKTRDPITRLQRRLLELELIDEPEIAAIQAEAQAAIEAAVEFARSSPDPDPAGLEDEVYA
ncbi:MAG TPA: thiamine pyrophosphate-dependent dehydrogenase E1 component subunit alpha [Roseiflexaceae bacterium]|nr:thiamine pyrophosphate-dependent dehydrogenase E1 component subunit alpha [Roseiflexaceae bacterium]